MDFSGKTGNAGPGRRVLCLGDSNTFGYDPRSLFGGRYPPEVRWTGLLNSRGWQLQNEGENGREIPGPELFRVYARLLESARPLDAVTVMLGSNDLLQHPGIAAEEVARRMERFLCALLQAVPEPRYLLIAPPPMRPGAWVGEERLVRESGKLAQCYGRIAEQLGIAFADAGAWGVGLSFDGVHFSPEGHAAFARGLEPQLCCLLRREEASAGG